MRLFVTLVLSLVILAVYGAGEPACGDTPTCNDISIVTTKLAVPFNLVDVSSDGSYVYGCRAEEVRVSSDYGASWTKIADVLDGAALFQGMFINTVDDTIDHVYFGKSGLGRLMRVEHNRTTAATDTTSLMVYDCSACPSGTCFGFWQMAEDSSDNLYFGEYAGEADPADTCGTVWKSADDGDTWARVRWSMGYRHTHLTAVNPYTDTVVVARGDGEGAQAVLTSADAGTTWTALHTTSCLSQPVSVAFTPGLMLFGSDCTAMANRVYSMAPDGTTTPRLVLSGAEDNFVWCMTRDPYTGVVLAGTNGNGHGNDANDVRLYGSGDGGVTWGSLVNLTDHDDWDGYTWLSQNFDDQGYGYYTVTQDDGEGFDAYRFKVVHTPHDAPPAATTAGARGARSKARGRGGRR